MEILNIKILKTDPLLAVDEKHLYFTDEFLATIFKKYSKPFQANSI